MTRLTVYPRTARRVLLAGGVHFYPKLAASFRRHGWEVFLTRDERNVQSIAAEITPQVIVLPEDAGDESGYLACAKLRLVQPELRLVIVGPERTPKRERLAQFVGATLATKADDIATTI